MLYEIKMLYKLSIKLNTHKVVQIYQCAVPHILKRKLTNTSNLHLYS